MPVVQVMNVMPVVQDWHNWQCLQNRQAYIPVEEKPLYLINYLLITNSLSFVFECFFVISLIIPIFEAIKIAGFLGIS